MPSMRLDQLMESRGRTLSFEFFPPKNDRAWYTLEDAIEQLAPLGPDFVSVTYGAGGGTRARTREIVEHIQGKTGITAMAHLTGVNATRAELTALLAKYHRRGHRELARPARQGSAQGPGALHPPPTAARPTPRS